MKNESERKKSTRSPTSRNNLISNLLFWWVYPILRLGTQREFQVNDLHDFFPIGQHESGNLGLILEREWKKELNQQQEKKYAKISRKNHKTPSFSKALFRSFGLKFLLLGGLPMVVECFLRIAQTICLGELLKCFEDGSIVPAENIYLYATSVVVMSALTSLIFHSFLFRIYLVGMNMKLAACSLIHRKCLRLNQQGLSQINAGKVVNLMSNDVTRFDLFAYSFQFLWLAPLQAAITTVVLYYYAIGISCLAGMIPVIFFVPLQIWMGKLFGRLRLNTAKKTDERIRNMGEIISGMRVIKLYAWEEPFEKLINLCRRVEIEVIRRTSFCRAVIESLFFSVSKLIVFGTIIVYVLTGNELTANKVFVTVALFENIRQNMLWFFPLAISSTAEARISVKRIQDFLLLDELQCNTIQSIPTNPANHVDCQLNFDHVTANWSLAGNDVTQSSNSIIENSTLKDISFKIYSGQSFAVIGQVGSGKSSLLNVILGELNPLLSGTCEVKGTIAYTSQEPWIFSGTIQQNILCGLNYDPQRFNAVVKATALEKDFVLFPNGEETIVGEKGACLSGGQKARINLARCLYVEADIYLMDDPLSAVDTHVGQHLFSEAINGFLRGKIRIIVTHQLQYLKEVDQILVLKKGIVEALGSYQELIESEMNVLQETKEDLFGQNQEGTFLNMENPSHSLSEKKEATINNLKKFPSSFTEEPIIISTISNMSKRETTTLNTINDEGKKSVNGVKFSTYWRYFHSGSGYVSLLVLAFSSIIAQALFNASDYWLSIWTNNAKPDKNIGNSTISLLNHGSWQDMIDQNTGTYVYSVLIGSLIVFAFIRSIHFFVICMKSSVKLHDEMFQAVVHAPMSFFDQHPIGAILNRFAKDLGCMDDQLPAILFDVISYALSVVGIIVVVTIVNPWLILPVFVLTLILGYLRKTYLTAARSITRLETSTRSPVFTQASSTLNGLTTLRAHQCQDNFQKMFDDLQNIHSSAWYMYLASTRWFCLWMEIIVGIYVACVTYTCVALRGSVSSSEAGLVITSSMALGRLLQWGIRQSAEAENQMISVERVIEYGQTISENEMESSLGLTGIIPSNKSNQQKGNIKFDNMSLQYGENENLVLKTISCEIHSKEKIGIVGRTGAGKSSLITALFRLAKLEGKILIDGVDTKTMTLRELRSKISIIPQDPVLFSGTLRMNLDPFKEHADGELIDSLENVKLKESMSEGLDFIVTDGGSNLSVGERQLICLARAIIRKNTILVLDEATANVDRKTDEFIQLIIREKFNDCTVLTIAHRLNTIMDSDRVMVMDSGYLKEFDEPLVLLENRKTIFSSLVEQSGNQNAKVLYKMAYKARCERMGKENDCEMSGTYL